MVCKTMLLHLLCKKHPHAVIFAVSGHILHKDWGLTHRPYDFRLQPLNSQCWDSYVPTITEGDKGFSSGKSEAKRGPVCRMLPFKSGMQEVTSGWQCVSEAQWKNCHVNFKIAASHDTKAHCITAQNKVLILEAVSPGNTTEHESFFIFLWISTLHG